MKLPEPDWDSVRKRIVGWLKDFFQRTGRVAVIGLSGGVDSAVTAALLSEALGPERVRALILPSASTPEKDVEDAKRVARLLGIEDVRVIDVEPALRAFDDLLKVDDRVVRGNTLARIRMTILYAVAHKDGIVVGTGDKSEFLLGYFTKCGDGCADVFPIGDLYKTWVRKLALHMGLPEDVALKPSSPRLWPGHLAEEELGFSYEVADVVLYNLVENGMRPQEIVERLGVDKEIVDRIIQRIKLNKHKLITPPIVKVTRRTAFEFVEEADALLT
ncbi:NAD+ synthase [Ignicoccus hospitalis]|nr:NAD+ synthase [Ignicoccus hospitalis]